MQRKFLKVLERFNNNFLSAHFSTWNSGSSKKVNNYQLTFTTSKFDDFMLATAFWFTFLFTINAKSKARSTVPGQNEASPRVNAEAALKTML